MTRSQPTSNELAEDRTDLAVMRTAMASERTLMGWVRTAFSMITFGFTIYKFLNAASQSEQVGVIGIQGPRRLGLFLIALGVISVTLGSLEYYQTIKWLNTLSARYYPVINITLISGILCGLLGAFLFVDIFTR